MAISKNLLYWLILQKRQYKETTNIDGKARELDTSLKIPIPLIVGGTTTDILSNIGIKYQLQDVTSNGSVLLDSVNIDNLVTKKGEKPKAERYNVVTSTPSLQELTLTIDIEGTVANSVLLQLLNQLFNVVINNGWRLSGSEEITKKEDTLYFTFVSPSMLAINYVYSSHSITEIADNNKRLVLSLVIPPSRNLLDVSLIDLIGKI